MRLSRINTTFIASLVCLPALAQAPAAPASPEGQEQMVRMMHLAAHNQLGILQYCQQQGSIGPEAQAVQQRLFTMLPPVRVDGIDAAEAAGKRGVVQFGGTEVPLTDAAKQQNSTPDAMCKQIASMLQAQAAQLPK